MARYRVARDQYYPSFWAVQIWRWYWPFWVEVGNGLIPTKAAAYDTIATMKRVVK